MTEKVKSNILWIEGQRVNITGMLDYFDNKKGEDEDFSYVHVFSTKDAEKEIKRIEGLKLVISNLYVDELDGPTVVELLKGYRTTEEAKDNPFLIFSSYVKNAELSRTPLPESCGEDAIKRLDDLKNMDNVHFLSFGSARDGVFYKAVKQEYS